MHPGGDPSQPPYVLRRVVGAGGRLLGAASFTPADWTVRRDVYRRLETTTTYLSWSQDPTTGRRTATRVPLPGGGTPAGTFHFTSHGGPTGLTPVDTRNRTIPDDGTRTAAVLTRLAPAPHYTSIIITACGPGTTPTAIDQATAQARRIADATGLTVHLAHGQVAITPGATPHTTDIHLLPAPTGHPTGWITIHPGTTAPTEPMAADGTSAPEPDAAYPDPVHLNAFRYSGGYGTRTDEVLELPPDGGA